MLAQRTGEKEEEKRLVRRETRALTLASLFETLARSTSGGELSRVYRLRVIREDTTNGVSSELRQTACRRLSF